MSHVKFKREADKLIIDNHFTLDHIYNSDESRPKYKMLPSKTLVSKEKTVTFGHKRCKERFSIMVCNNASGLHKISSIMVEKTAQPNRLR